MRNSARVLLVFIALLTFANALNATPSDGGAIVCEPYDGCRRFDYGGGTVACRCDALSICSECCDVPQNGTPPTCWVS